MKDCKVNVLGITYKIRFRNENEDETTRIVWLLRLFK